MILFVDVSPAFYKTLMLNELSKHEDIYVLYNGSVKRPYRDTSFLEGTRQFKNRWLRGSILSVIIQLQKELRHCKYRELVVGGYDTLLSWTAVLLSSKRKNSCIIESTLRETKKQGVRALAKRFFFSRVSKAYVCGKSHSDLVRYFGFHGNTIDIGSVGFIRRVPQPPFEERKEVTSFLYVGRLTFVKNLEWLINRFRLHPNLILTIVGTGELEDSLKGLAPSNVVFMGGISNDKLSHIYKKADVFILASLSETYGLVVEEALNNGTPVMLSHMVGCQDDLVVKNNVGVVFALNDVNDFEDKLSMICNPQYYNNLRYNISKLDFEDHERKMIQAFLS